MKTKKCFDICKKSEVFYVYQAEYDEQWLSDGSACYPITGLPMLTEDSICTVSYTHLTLPTTERV